MCAAIRFICLAIVIARCFIPSKVVSDAQTSVGGGGHFRRDPIYPVFASKQLTACMHTKQHLTYPKLSPHQ